MKHNERIPKLTIIAEDRATSTIAQGFIGNDVIWRLEMSVKPFLFNARPKKDESSHV